MAEFLLGNRNNPNPLGTQLNDIIDVREDGWPWSKSELPNVVKRPDLTLAEAIKYRQGDYEVYVVPKVGRNNQYYTADLKRIDVVAGDITAEEPLKETKTTDSIRIASRKGNDLSDTDKGEVTMFHAGVELETTQKRVFFGKRRWKYEAGNFVDKTP